MVALRLETELPYPVAESTWVCERQPTEDTSTGGNVLVIAVPTAEIAEPEKELARVGLRCGAVMLDACALAELTLSPDRPEEPCAVANIGEMPSVAGQAAAWMTTLTITHHGKLRYARRIFTNSMSPNSDEVSADAVLKLASELDQCIHHYALHTRAEEPRRLFLVGEGARAEGLVAILADRLGMPVEAATLPREISIASPEVAEDDLLGLYAGCVGALLAVHRRLRGEETAAPALRQRKPTLVETGLFKRAILVGVNLLVVVALVAGLFGVRKAQMAAAGRIVEQGRPLLQDMDRLKSEVDILEYEQRLQQPVLDVLLSLAEVLPKGLKIATLSIDSRNRVTIAGISPSVEEVSQKAISAMNESKMFTEAKLSGPITKGKDGWNFRITCELRKVQAVPLRTGR
jgi:Tfp pilus assembly protein PilN